MKISFYEIFLIITKYKSLNFGSPRISTNNKYS